MIAYGGTVEEQDRFTLHIHLLTWLMNFNHVRDNMFSEDLDVRDKARGCMVQYITNIMTASYPDLDLTHTTTNEGSEICTGTILPVSDQKIRNLRHKKRCMDDYGIVGKCKSCHQSFTTVKMVNNSLNIWKQEIASEKNHTFQHPLSRERSDVYAMLFPYRKISMSKQQSKSELLKERYYTTLNLLKFNEHDYCHRRSCFKNGLECRFKLPYQVNEKDYIQYGTQPSIWNKLNGKDRKVTSFKVMLKRNMGDQFLNTCSLGLAQTSGYNTNVQVGDVAHVFYNTLYGSKSTQKDDTRGYLSVSTAITSRIIYQQKQLEEEKKDAEEVLPEFSEGLKRILQAIYANISSYIISPTMAHHIITTGSRFMFSHKTKPLLLAQMEDFLNGKNISFTLRSTKGEKKRLWADSQVYDIIFRPDELENTCYYEFVEKYNVQNLPVKSESIFRFQHDHPGYSSRGVKRKDIFDVPMIYMPPFADLYDLELDKGSLHVDEEVTEARNIYALRALILFFPFRKIEDLNESGAVSYWEKFQKSKSGNALYSNGCNILQNIQDRHNLKRIVRGEDDIESKTTYIEDLGESLQYGCDNESDCDEEIDPEKFIPQNMALTNNKALDFLRDSNEGTHLTLIGRHKHQQFHIKGSLAKEDNAIFYESDVDEKEKRIVRILIW